MKCPNCGNEEIIINEAYDKNIDYTLKFKILVIVSLIVGIIISLALIKINAIVGGVFFFVFLIAFCAYLNYKIILRKRARRKSHSKCICKNCGYTWYLD